MIQTLVIMQGPSGVGKSTVSQALREVYKNEVGYLAQVYSTDDFFWVGGEYAFDKSALPTAHQWNQDRVKSDLSKGYSVIVDNTNIKAWQARPYVEMARGLCVPIIFIRISGENWGNTHGVPAEVVQQMSEGMEDLTVKSCLQAKYPWETADQTIQA